MKRRRVFAKRGSALSSGVKKIIPISETDLFILPAQGSTGRAYGSWITGARASAVTDANVVSGGVIVNPVGVIESIVQDELITRQSFSDLDVDTDSFDTAYDLRSSWYFNISIHNQISAFDLLQDLALQAACKLFFSYDKKIKIKAYNSSNSLNYYYVGNSSITNPAESLNYGRIVDGSLLLVPISLADVYNKIEVYYLWDYGRNKYRQSVYVDGSDSNWDTVTDTTAIANCAAANTNYHVNQTFNFEASAIQDKTTAERLCDYFSGRLTRRLYVCSFECGLEGIQIELGDFVNIQHSLISGIWSGTYTTKKWEVIERRFNPNKMTFTISAIEV